MLVLPTPLMSQESIESPVFWFSQATGLAAAAHGSAALALESPTKEPATIPSAAAATPICRLRPRVALGNGLITAVAQPDARRIPSKRSPVNAVPPVIEQVMSRQENAIGVACLLVLLMHAESDTY